jgi:hypothetical protein
MVIIACGALWSAVLNLREHHAYGFAGRMALFSAALVTFVNSTGLERLIRDRPIVALTIAAILVSLIAGYYIMFFVVFPPPK